MKNAAADSVRYIEARFAPLLSVQNGLSVERIIESVLQGMEQGKSEFGIDYGVIVCAMRHEKEAENLKMLKAARQFLGNGVCAARSGRKRSSISNVTVSGFVCRSKTIGDAVYDSCGECRQCSECSGAVQCGASRIDMGSHFADKKRRSGFAGTDRSG